MKRAFQFVVFIILFKGCGVISFAWATEAEHISLPLDGGCILRLGWGDWPPYQTLIDDEPKGIQIDLIKQIAHEADCKLTFKLQSFTQNQEGIKNGTIDITLDTTVTPERSQYGYFSEPYRNEVLALYVRPEFIEACQTDSIRSLVKNGLRLGVTRDNIYGETLALVQADPELNQKLVYRDLNTHHFTLLKQNKIDGLVEDPMVMAYSLRHDSAIGQLEVCRVTVSSSSVSLMFSKKTISQELVARFNKALKKIKSQKDYKKNWSWSID